MKKSGAYLITCVPTGERYVGGSVHLARRISVHKTELRHGIHFCKRLQSAWDKYGPSKFLFEYLEFDEDALAAEQRWLDKLKPEFNVHTVANPVGREMPGVIREKMRGPRPSLAGNQNALGAKRSPETRAKMGAAKKGKPSKLRGRTLSAETKAKISATKRHRQLPLIT